MKNTKSVSSGFLGDKFKSTSLNDKTIQLIKVPSKLTNEEFNELKRIRLLKKQLLAYYKDWINELYQRVILDKLTNNKTS